MKNHAHTLLAFLSIHCEMQMKLRMPKKSIEILSKLNNVHHCITEVMTPVVNTALHGKQTSTSDCESPKYLVFIWSYNKDILEQKHTAVESLDLYEKIVPEMWCSLGRHENGTEGPARKGEETRKAFSDYDALMNITERIRWSTHPCHVGWKEEVNMNLESLSIYHILLVILFFVLMEQNRIAIYIYIF